MRNILLILFLFLLFSCKKEEKVEYYIKYEVQGKSRNNISLSPTGLQVIYTYFTDYKPVTKIESNDEKHEYIIGPVEKGFVATGWNFLMMSIVFSNVKTFC